VRDANRRFGWQLPDDAAITLAGLMIETLEHLPVQGEHCVIHGLTLTVAAKRGHRLERIRIHPAAS
jgi:Mg2+/Co2+ transporter CorB